MIRHGTAPFLECSSKGDKRFSAFYARVNGKSIEEQYQAKKQFADGSTGLNWRQAKGRRAVNQEECAKFYSALWDQYIAEHPELLEVLRKASGLSDIFGQAGHCCQATELWRIRNQHMKGGARTRTHPQGEENMKLSRREYAFLRWAVVRAEEWRGELIGNPDPIPLQNFDAAIKEAKAALKKISPYKKGGTSN